MVEEIPARSVETLAWVEAHGVVLQSARGPVPNVATFIAGEPIRGSWWGHPAGKEIYEVLNVLDESPDIVTTRLINGKVTLLHSRVWPAIVRVADEIGVERLAAVHQEHTASGAHRSFTVEFPLWVPADVRAHASRLSRDQAFNVLPDCLQRKF
jgi:hypothetical protein